MGHFGRTKNGHHRRVEAIRWGLLEEVVAQNKGGKWMADDGHYKQQGQRCLLSFLKPNALAFLFQPQTKVLNQGSEDVYALHVGRVVTMKITEEQVTTEDLWHGEYHSSLWGSRVHGKSPPKAPQRLQSHVWIGGKTDWAGGLLSPGHQYGRAVLSPIGDLEWFLSLQLAFVL